MKSALLGAAALCVISFNANAHNSPYWVGSSGNYVRSGSGGCIRTVYWTPETALAECEGGAVKAKAPEKAPEPVAQKPAPAKPAPAAPTYRNLSLASSASFGLGGSTLSDSGKSAVKDLLSEFDGKEIKSISVEGHTDNSGDAAYNQHLSEKRAEAVKAELVNNGIDASIITTVGHGEDMPIADNSTREGRAKNRRVEIKIDASEKQ